jgi:hypothetical protein
MVGHPHHRPRGVGNVVDIEHWRIQVRLASTSALRTFELRREPLSEQWLLAGITDPASSSPPGGQLDPRVTVLFRAALEAKVPHNYFALWMMTPARELSQDPAVGLSGHDCSSGS